MSIVLKYFYDIQSGTCFFDPTTVKFCQDSFNQSINDIKDFFTFTAMDVNNLEIKVFVQNEFNESNGDIDAIRCMLSDIRNENSCTHKLLASLFEETDAVEKKISMTRYLLENYFVCTRLYNTRMNDQNFVECYHNYWGRYDFKYTLPKTVISKYVRDYDDFGANFVKLSQLSVEELVMYVMPRYYQEIGWFDREFLRKDADKMAILSTSWMG